MPKRFTNWNFWRTLSIGLLSVLLVESTSDRVIAQPASSTFKTFTEWCNNKETLPSDARHTVEVLLTEAKTKECDRAEATLTRLTDLDLGSSKLKDLRPLSSLANLKVLDLGSNQITDLQPLSSLTNLRILILAGNQITDVKPLAQLTNLEELLLIANQIADVSSLASLTKLTQLSLGINQIADVSPLASLTNLTWLTLNDNQVVDVKPLASLTGLKLLTLSDNQIKDVAPLATLTNLEILHLYNNQIEQVQSLSTLKRVQRLWFQGNPLRDRTCPVTPPSICGFAQTAVDRKAEADRLLETSTQQYRNNQFQAALETLQQELVIRKDIKDRSGEATALNSLGFIYKHLGQTAKALEYYQQALTLRKQIGDRVGEGITLNNIGLVYNSLGQTDKALEFYQQALAIYREKGFREAFLQESYSGEGRLLNSIAGVYERLGQYAKTLEFLQQSLSIYRRIGDIKGEGGILNNIGAVYNRLGQYAKALEFFQQSLAIRKQLGDIQGEGQSLNNMGHVYDNLGQYPKALELFQQALAIRKRSGDRFGEGVTLNNIGDVYNSLGQYANALEFFQQALGIVKQVGDRLAEGTTLNNIGQAYYGSKQNTKALEFLQQALTIQKDIGDREGEGRTLNNIGSLLAEQKQPELAIVFLKQSISTYEAIRNDLRQLPGQQQESYTETVAHTYRRLADILLQQDRILEGQQVLDLLKVQELEGYLRNVRGNPQTERGIEILRPEMDILKKYNALQQSAIQLGQELSQLRKIPEQGRTTEQKQRLAQLVKLEADLNQQFNQFIDSPEVVKAAEQLSRTARRQNINLEDLNALRDDLRKYNAALLYPLILDDRLDLILTTPDAAPIRRSVKVNREELNQAIAEFRNQLVPGHNPKPVAQKLYQWLIQPLEADLKQAKISTIIYAPDTQLRYIPLAALYDGEKWLVQRYQINHITARSLTNFAVPAQSQKRLLAGAFVQGTYEVQVSQRWFAFNGLPFAGKEVELLTAIVPNTTKLIDQAFSRDAILPKLNEYSIVHFATHGAFVSGQPEDSFILFGNGDRATLREIETWSLQNVDLVVLSACETALGGKLGNGEEILGLGYQFQRAGARATIASLWAVDDGGTQVLMNAFYLALNQGMTKAQALQEAQKALITGNYSAIEKARSEPGMAVPEAEQFRSVNSGRLYHPYYWSAFILIGNGL